MIENHNEPTRTIIRHVPYSERVYMYNQNTETTAKIVLRILGVLLFIAIAVRFVWFLYSI